MQEGDARTSGMQSAVLLRRGGLLDKAEAALQRTLAADPHNAKALLRLGDVLRGKGSFPAALDAYRRLCALEPGNARAHWLSAILSGGPPPSAAPSGRRPAPFVLLKDFLPQPQQERLFELTLADSQRFTQAGVIFKQDKDRGRVAPKTRTALVADAQTAREARPLVIPRLRSILPCVLARLGVQGLDQYLVEMNVTAHLAGGYFRPHRDDSHQIHHCRRVSYVYYFHRQPKRFSGGDLLLYDTDLEAKEADPKPHSFFRVKPRHNSLVFFPSSYVHEITPVECASQDFADGRFTVNGWIRSRGERAAGRRNGPSS